MIRPKFAFSVEDLFENFDVKPINVYGKWRDKRLMACVIFKDCFYQILLDIINNNTTFVLPLKYHDYGEICMERYEDEEFKRLYKKGKFRDVDYVLSQFAGHSLVFRYRTQSTVSKKKPIYVNKELKQIITDYTNQGKVYY